MKAMNMLEEARQLRAEAKALKEAGNRWAKKHEMWLAHTLWASAESKMRVAEEYEFAYMQAQKMLDDLDDNRECSRTLHESGWRNYDNQAVNFRSDWFDMCEAREDFAYEGFDMYNM